MCGVPVDEYARTKYDPVTRCTVYGDIATRYFGDPEDILAEIEAAGFRIIAHVRRASQGPTDQDMLFVNAVG